VSVERPTTDRIRLPGDPVSRRWCEQLHRDHPRHDQAVGSLHDLLRRAAVELGQLPDTIAPRPGRQAEQREQLSILKRAIEHDLTDRQREVFVAIALNDVPIDVLALELDSNRNAIYKNLFDARRKLRERLADAGHPVSEEERA
jgi:DNA-directed RNA polymerase specialized sigma24 family protein